MRKQGDAKIPVVDFSKGDELKAGTSSWVSATKAVCHALEEYGCFVATLRNQASLLNLHNSMFGALAELFGFPKEIKVQNAYDKPFRGYHSPHALHEGLGIDNPTNPQQIHDFSNLFWPNGNHHFCENAHSYARLVIGLDQMVTRMIFEHYGVETKHCDAHIGSTDYVVRLHKYNELPQMIETHNALPEHSDMNLTTIIHQNHVNGLEIRTKDGEWVGFDASPSSFVFMTGDAFQVWSNDRIKPCVHRVVMRGNEVRYSLLLSTFFNGTISVPPELVDERHPLRYKPLNHLQYLSSQLGQTTRICVRDFCGL